MPYAPAHDSSFLTRRGFVFVLIVVLHLGMYYVLNSGLSQHLVDVVLGPIETRMIEEAPKTDEPPPPPPPKIETPPPFVPPPEVSIEIPVEATTSTAIQTVDERAPDGAAAAGRRRQRRYRAPRRSPIRAGRCRSPNIRLRRAAPVKPAP